VEIFKSDGTAAGTVQVTHGNGVPDDRSLGPFLGTIRGKLVYGAATVCSLLRRTEAA
jgi:hypothetical protein